MALFPRKVSGHYAMVSRQDNENLFLISTFRRSTSGTRSTAPDQTHLPVGVRANRQLWLAHQETREGWRSS